MGEVCMSVQLIQPKCCTIRSKALVKHCSNAHAQLLQLNSIQCSSVEMKPDRISIVFSLCKEKLHFVHSGLRFAVGSDDQLVGCS